MPRVVGDRCSQAIVVRPAAFTGGILRRMQGFPRLRRGGSSAGDPQIAERVLKRAPDAYLVAPVRLRRTHPAGCGFDLGEHPAPLWPVNGQVGDACAGEPQHRASDLPQRVNDGRFIRIAFCCPAVYSHDIRQSFDGDELNTPGKNGNPLKGGFPFFPGVECQGIFPVFPGKSRYGTLASLGML